MKILTILGTRPEIIRLSRIIPTLDKFVNHKVVYTGQNFDRNLSDIFFEDLKLRKPDYLLATKSNTLMEQVGKILLETEKIIEKEKPDRLLILGDTNSALSAFVAKRMGIKVFHMEAGNRCHDDRVPEEVNRRVIDHSSDILLPYTKNSRDNLIKEGIPLERVYVTGNPIKEVLDYYDNEISSGEILEKLKIESKKYFLITLHRAENVNDPERLKQFLKAFDQIDRKYHLPIVLSLHPHTQKQLEKQKLKLKQSIFASKPFGLFDFVHLEKNAFCVLSDSGTVQEECCIFGVPNVTLRDTTERPETLECGSNFLAGADEAKILTGIKIATNNSAAWQPPAEYMVTNVSLTVAKIITGFWY